jgi:hypothetical protein
MPEWLRLLLSRHGSAGLVDSLSILTGMQPGYQQLPAQPRVMQDQPGQLAGRFFADAAGNPVIGLTPYTIQNFGNPANGIKFGEKILAHEFGHAAASGYGNIGLANALAELYPQREDVEAESEALADDFQQAVQYLRPNRADDIGRLNPRTQRLLSVFLQQELYKNHVLNQQQKATADFIRSVIAGHPKTLPESASVRPR